MIDIQLIPAKVREIAARATTYTTAIEHDLNSGLAKAAAAYIPEGEACREVLISLCDIAIAACQKLDAAAESAQVKAILQRLGSDITAAAHLHQHTITTYIVWFEHVFAHIAGKNTTN